MKGHAPVGLAGYRSAGVCMRPAVHPVASGEHEIPPLALPCSFVEMRLARLEVIRTEGRLRTARTPTGY